MATTVNVVVKREIFFFLLCFVSLFIYSSGRRHELKLQNEARKSFELSKFGFLKDGFLQVEVSKMVYNDEETFLRNKDLSNNFGFSLEKTASDGISPYMEQHAEQCILRSQNSFTSSISVAVFIFDLNNDSIVVHRYGPDFDKLKIGVIPSVKDTKITQSQNTSSQTSTEALATKDSPPKSTQSTMTKPPSVQTTKSTVQGTTLSLTTTKFTTSSEANNNKSSRARRDVSSNPEKILVKTSYLPLYSKKRNRSIEYYGNFTVKIKDKSEEGLYNLYFHNCANYLTKTRVTVDIQVKIVEKNVNNYLSAGEEPLPFLFGVMAVVFFCTAFLWLYVLRQNTENTFKVHYMMFVLIILKSMDLAFDAINLYYIGSDGKPKGSWAIVYYITHLLKGALLFTTIVLIGTGYFFVKHVLSDRDKKIFLMVIPLQILANTAQIVMESTEEAKVQYTTWKELFILVDLMCCGAILFPVVWSIRHLQEASKTDGKAAINLVKLKLFRHFYVMVVCYIYFTRIIVYLIKITVPFQYMWFDELFNNTATYIFFVLTGYNFRPFPDNPYLHVAQEDSDEEIEMDEVVTTSGLTDGVTRVQPLKKVNRDNGQSSKMSV